jgi:hypothetical protein
MQIRAGFTISCSRSGPPGNAAFARTVTGGVRCPTPICERSIILIRKPFDEMSDATPGPGHLDPHERFDERKSIGGDLPHVRRSAASYHMALG